MFQFHFLRSINFKSTKKQLDLCKDFIPLLFRGLGKILTKISLFLVDLKIPKSPFEIKWSLKARKLYESYFPLDFGP